MMQNPARSLVKQAIRAAVTNGQPILAVRALASTPAKFATEGKLPKNVKSKLLQKIESEIKAEAQQEQETPIDERISPLKEEGVWTVDEVPGQNNLALTRSYGKESIRVTFSCQPPALDEIDDQFEEDMEQQDTEAGNPAETSEGREQEVEEEEEDDELGPELEPYEVTVIVQTQGKPSMVADIMLGTDGVEIEGIRIFDAGASVDTAAMRASEAYEGPLFSHLDPDVQELLTDYLAERGIDSQLHLHIEDAKAWKEQREYVGWLGKLRQLLQ